MEPDRSADTFILRVRRERGPAPHLVERWQVEHVQTGLNVYVHSLDEAVAVIRSSLGPHPRRLRPRRR